ncbi:MAG: PAS domain S-box protein [Gammaproteobacteria bacterium]|nr:PAS domain S-box protein [Gammaproteobacteria bacterium]NNM21480.1 PAS domain S-box protein [Gammaproteobacteria bacterium]
MNEVLVRQLRKAAQKSSDGQPDLEELCVLISEHYEAIERERRLTDRALRLMSDELQDLNRRTLEQGEGRVRAIMENMADPLFSVNDAGVIEHCNPAAETLFGHSADDMVGRSLSILIPTVTQALPAEFLERLTDRTDRKDPVADLLARRADGKMFPIDATASETMLEERRLFMVSIRDITVRKNKENVLRESEERYRMLVEHAPEAIIVLDADTRMITDVNRHAVELFGFNRSELLGKAYQDLSPEHQPDGSQSELSALTFLARTMSGESPVFEWHCQAQDGSRFPAEISYVRFPSASQNLIRASIVNISERKEAEQRLRYSAEFERFLSDLCANLIEASLKGIDKSIIDAIERICEFREVERGSVYQFSTNSADRPDLVECTHEWGRKSEYAERLLLDTELPWLAANVRQVRVFHVADTATLPPEAWRERKRCQENDIGSLAVVPMLADSKLVGFLMFESSSAAGQWPQQVLDRLRLVGDIFVSQLQHGRAASDQQRLMSLLEATPDLVVMSDRSGAVSYLNSSGRRQLGLSADEDLSGMSLADLCCESDAQVVREQGLQKAVRDGAWQSTLQMQDANGEAFPVSQITIAHRQDNGAVDYFSTVARDITQQQAAAATLRSKEEQLRMALAAARMGTWVWYIESNKVVWSSRTAELFGVQPDEFSGTFEAYFSCVHPDDRELVEQTISRALAGGDEHYAVEHRIVRDDGAISWIEGKGKIHRDNNGRPLRMMGTVTDISARKDAERAIFQEKERAQVTLQSIGDAVITTDEHGLVEYLNPMAEQRLGCTAGSVAGRLVDDLLTLVSDDSGSVIENPVLQCLREGRTVEGKSGTVLRSGNGEEFAIQFSAAPIRSREGIVIGSVMVFHDVSQERSLYQRMSYQAAHDALTGLINRRELENRLTEAVQGVWQDEKLEHCLLYFDLDQFKVVNDTCGHSAGDELLKRVTALLQEQIRSTDCLARLGGDEFCLLLIDCPLQRAERIAEKIRSSVNDFRFIWHDRTFGVSASIGVVQIDARSESISSVLSAADVACYAAKDAGRNRVSIYRAEAAPSQHKQMQWVSRITQACEDDRLTLFYHPIIPLDETDSKQHFELLLRMRDPYGKLVPPNSFIPAAERYNLMSVIDRWVVRHALANLVQRNKLPDGKAYTLSINLSGSSLSDPYFLSALRTELESHHYEKGAICFEITETAAISNLDEVVHFMHEIRKLGCEFSLDDFGSGLSSFAYLKDLPVDYLKIDRHFVKNIAHDVVDHSMVAAINQVGHVMGLKTIAEGIETNEVLAKVRAAGVNYAQGFLFAMPEEATGREVFAPQETATIIEFNKAEAV